jgi:hypothetical protein
VFTLQHCPQVIPDPTLLLPVLVGVGFLAGTEVSSLQFYDKNLTDSIRAKHIAIRSGGNFFLFWPKTVP